MKHFVKFFSICVLLSFGMHAWSQAPGLPASVAVTPGAGNATARVLPDTVKPQLAQVPDWGGQDTRRSAAVSPVVGRTQGSSQFQQFVLENTGRSLPLFGFELFDNPQVYAPDSTVPAPADYVLGPGDEVRIQIWGAIDFFGTQTLDRNGQINLPKIGALNLSGVQVKDLEQVLRKNFGALFNNFFINASLGKMRGITVYVVGQVHQPGTYNLSGLNTLINAVFASGGPSVNGSMRDIQLRRNGQVVTRLDLYEFIAKGDRSNDAVLKPGDVIMIPPAGPRVALTGATDRAAIYELRKGDKVQDLLAWAGGLSALALPQKALLERISTERKMPREVKELSLEADGLQQVLKDADVLTLLPISPAFANAVTLQGAVAQSLRHKWFEGMRISDLIPDREALITKDYYQRKNQLVQMSGDGAAKATSSLTGERFRLYSDQINWDYAMIERLNRAELRTELIPFNLSRAVNQRDPEHNLQLFAGDVVTILSSSDLRVPVQRQTRLVRVEGEVAMPGLYSVKRGETLPQLLERLGGITSDAYLYGTEFTRESVRRQQQENIEQLSRRLEVQSQSAAIALVSNLPTDRMQQASSLQQFQQVQFQSQIARLKTMKSKGRVALGLEPGLQRVDELPDIPLEDGDSITVPSKPTFVAVIGSVNNDNFILYKAGMTVGDVLLTAGVNEEAEPKETFLVRADGSIVGRKNFSRFNSFERLVLMPGDAVVVPARVDRESSYNFWVRGLKDWTQIFSNLGLGAAAIRTLRN